MVGKDDKGHRSVKNIGKHSVDVNVRISRAPTTSAVRRKELPTVESSPWQPQQHRSSNNGFINYKRGSWADLLNSRRSGSIMADQKCGQKALPDRQHSVLSTGTQTEQEVPRNIPSTASSNCDTCNREMAIQVKDYVETINQLRNLCSSLRRELRESNRKNVKMSAKFLDIIREKDLIISYQQSLRGTVSQPSPPTTPRSGISEVDINSFRDAIQRMRDLINGEVDDMKKRMATPLTPPNPQLAKFLSQMSFTDSEVTDDGQGDADTSYLKFAEGMRRHKNSKGSEGQSSSETGSHSSLARTGSDCAGDGGGDHA